MIWTLNSGIFCPRRAKPHGALRPRCPLHGSWDGPTRTQTVPHAVKLLAGNPPTLCEFRYSLVSRHGTEAEPLSGRTRHGRREPRAVRATLNRPPPAEELLLFSCGHSVPRAHFDGAHPTWFPDQHIGAASLGPSDAFPQFHRTPPPPSAGRGSDGACSGSSGVSLKDTHVQHGTSLTAGGGGWGGTVGRAAVATFQLQELLTNASPPLPVTASAVVREYKQRACALACPGCTARAVGEYVQLPPAVLAQLTADTDAAEPRPC
jgi:hypothetical protein